MDKILWRIIEKEIERQQTTIDLIPSENFVDLETLFLIGSPLTNKYAEGKVGKRYYPGNKFIDQIETLAQKRALKAFRLNENKWKVNVQPYSGSPANLAVYLALLKPGETLLGLNLFHGGHLTHGHQASYSGKLFKSISYHVNLSTGLIDYDEIERLAKKYKPKIIVSGTTSYPRKIDFQRIGTIAHQIGAWHLADISHIAGLVIADLHPSPFKWADIVTMTTHKTLKGPRGAVIFYRQEFGDIIEKSVFPGMQGGPHENIIAAIAFTFGQALSLSFKRYQRQIVKNAKAFEKYLKDFGFSLFTGGTDNHLLVIDLKPLGLSGYEAEKILEEANILANRNSLPSDKSPFKPSGLRLGTPAITSRGFKEKEIKIISEFLYKILILKYKPRLIKKEVIDFIYNYPIIYNEWLKVVKNQLSTIRR